MSPAWAAAAFLLALQPAAGATVHAAVAANFTAVAERLAADFTASTGHEVVFSFGATGALYTQITQAAPFDVFLAADDTRTAAALADGHAVAGTEFTYALGILALYAPGADLSDAPTLLAAGEFHHLALADPATAPYGAAALAVLERLGLAKSLSPRLVTGENVTQTLQFVDSGSAELGFVAWSQVLDRSPAEVWRVPAQLHPPIRQNAVLLNGGRGNEAAAAFLAYLRSAAATALIEAAGYNVE